MENRQNRYVLASSGIIHETIQEDTLVINLHTGMYFNFSDTASKIWSLLINGASEEDVSNLILQRYSVSDSQVGEDISCFLSELESHGLLKKVSSDLDVDRTAVSISFTSDIYNKPIVNCYSDMESLLLADPLHEFVDD